MLENLGNPKSLFDQAFEIIQTHFLPLNFRNFLKKNLLVDFIEIDSIKIDKSNCWITTKDNKKFKFFYKEDILYENNLRVENGCFIYVCVYIGLYLYQYEYKIIGTAGGSTEWLSSVSVFKFEKEKELYENLKSYPRTGDYYSIVDIQKDLKITE